MALVLKALGGIAALILLGVALLGQLITIGGFLLVAMKTLIVVVFLALLIMIVFSTLRDRSRRRRQVDDI
ncbi:MAG TPA: hypothetical protein DHU55_10450 [Blastocatellia bacterium]|jgi:hypothetical protein|nr:hypothetical protein [Blastocatellia bacterium]HCX30172.1 hypothetical protein [Blastocatellia bacterium]